MPTWNQLPDGGDWLNRSRTPLSTNSSSLSSANAVAHPLTSRPSSPKPSSSSSANAAERQIKERQQLNSHLPPEDRVAVKPPAKHFLPSRPSSPKPLSSSSANAAERQIKERQQLNSHLPPEDRVAVKPPAHHPSPSRSISPKPSFNNSLGSANAAEYRMQKKAKETFNNNYKPNLHPTPGSAADFRLAEERSKLAYDQNRPKLDAQVQQTVQQIRQERITSPEQHKSLWGNITDKGSDIKNKFVEGASDVKDTVSNTAKNAWDQQQKSSFSPLKLQQDFAIGVVKGGWDAVKGTAGLAKGIYDMSPLNPDIEGRRQTSQKFGETVVSLAQNPAVQSLSNPILAAQNFASRPRETTQAFKDLGTGIAQPYVDAVKSGHPAEAAGLFTVDVVSMFVPGGAVAKVGKAGQVAAVAARTAEVSSRASTGARVATDIAEVASRTSTTAKVAGKGAEATASRLPVHTKSSKLTSIITPEPSKPTIKPSNPKRSLTPSSVSKSTGGGESTSLSGSTDGIRPLGGREANPRPLHHPDPVYGGTHSGTRSGRAFTPMESGGPIQNLSNERLKIQDNGIDAIENHVSRFGHDSQNAAQIQRLRQIATGKLKPTAADLNFYAHELRESVRYRKLGYKTGQPTDTDAADRLWNNAHTATLEDYGIKEGKGVLYHPSVEMDSEMGKPLGARGSKRLYNKEFKNEQLKIINRAVEDKGTHPLQFLVRNNAWVTGKSHSEDLGVQAGHLTSLHSGAPERLALEDPLFNWMDGTYGERRGDIFLKKAINISGIAVEKGTAQMWEELGFLPKGTVSNAQPHPGWTLR